MNNKILILVNHDLVIYNFRKELVEKLIENGYDIYISSPNGERIDYFVQIGCNFIETKINRHGISFFEDLKLLKKYKKIIKEVNPFVVLTYTIKPNIYGGLAAKKCNIPYIANITGLGTALEKKSLLQFLLIVMYKRAFSKIHVVFFQNKENKDFFTKYRIALNSQKLIPGSGVNINHFNYIKYPSNTKIHFAFISRIMKKKGIEEYLYAARIIREKYPNTIFHVCGFCEERYETIIEKYSSENIIVYHGQVSDVRQIFKDIHCVVHPSNYPEGISNILLEAASSGRPLITTNRSGCRETVDENETGFYVEPENELDLIEKVENFLHLSYEQMKEMGIRGRNKVSIEFNRDDVIKAYLEEIEILENSTN